MTAPLPEDVELDRTALAKIRDFLARARARFIGAKGAEKTSAELSVQFGEAAVKKVLMAPHRDRQREQEMANIWAAVQAQGRLLQQLQSGTQASLQRVQAALQQTQATVQSLATAVEAERTDRDDVRQAIGGFRADPSGAALALLAKHRAQDAAKEKATAERATAKWESKRQALEADIARKQKILDRFNHDRDIEPDDIRHQALTRHITKILAEKIQAMDALSTLLDERPH